MRDKDIRRRLLALLDRELFEPVLQTTREDIDGAVDKHHFDDAKKKVAGERQRYHDSCLTSADVKENFLRDLESRSSTRLNENLRSLELPTYWDVKDDFVKLCETHQL